MKDSIKASMIMICVLLLVLATGCGKNERVYVEGPANGCTALEVDGGVELTCGDEVILISDGSNGIDGQDGSDGIDGVDGSNGSDGESCSAVATDDGVLLTCPNSDPILIPICDDECEEEDEDDCDDDKKGKGHRHSHHNKKHCD